MLESRISKNPRATVGDGIRRNIDKSKLQMREEQLNQMNKSAIAKSMGGDASAPTIVNAPTIKSSTNTSNSNTSSTSFIGNPDQAFAMSAGSY